MMTSSLRWAASIMFPTIWICGCMTWRVHNDALSTVVEARPSHIRVSGPLLTPVVLRYPELSGDTLRGINRTMTFTPGLPSKPADSLHTVLLGDITTVETREVSPVRTVLFVSVGSVATYFIVAVAQWMTAKD